MTITTAKMPDSFKLAPLALALAAMLVSAECHADWRITPHVDLRETYSDNVNLQSDALARGSFITEAAPGVGVSVNGPRLTLNADAGWRAFSYSNKDVPNLNNSQRNYNATAQAKLVDDLFYVDAAANGSRQAISAFGPLGTNPYSSTNNTDVSTWRISPYLRHRFGTTADLTLRYTRDSVEGGVGGFGNSTGSTRALDLTSGTGFTTLGGNLSYMHQDLKDSLAGESSSENVTAGLRWNVIRRLSLTGNVGYDKYEYPAFGERTQGRSWTGGFIWTPSTRTSLQASFGRRYFGKTGSLTSSYRTRRSIWSLDYSDTITTTRSQLLLPSAVDTAAMLDGLFAASYPDPAQRQQAVQAYIAATGLPATLPNSINYLSNRYMRVKRLQGSGILRGARSNLTLTVFNDVRNAVSMQQSDSDLLGSQLTTLNDNATQHGASVNGDYRLSSRTSASAAVTASRIRSLITDTVNNNVEMRMGMNHRFAAKMQGSVDLRRSRGGTGLIGNGSYHENAITATFSVAY